MSRDRIVDRPDEETRHRHLDTGREVSRSGRAGTPKRDADIPSRDVREALIRQVDLPRGEGREHVWLRDQEYRLRGSEVRALGAIGAFRVVDVQDVVSDGSADRWHGDLDQLRRSGLIEIRAHVLEGRRTAIASLTPQGRALLEDHQRAPRDDARQAYYAGVAKPRELAHDARIYRVYAETAARLHDAGARVRRVVLDYELKREYQQFLQAPNRGDRWSDGRPARSPEEVQTWAAAHALPVVDGHVQFPDVRIEYEWPDGRRDQRDVEVATPDYNSRQMAAKRASGFTMHQSGTSRLRGGNGRRGASPFDPHAAEGVLR
jgi:DNA-binding MarR family transcriptional regulator